jgi:undecaprenyl-diphosphatase
MIVVSYPDAVIIGILQGFIEWLPISSEGNIVLLLMSIFNLHPHNAVQYALFLHLGTGVAASIYFRNEIRELAYAKTDETKNLRTQLIIITLTTGIVGLPIWILLELSSSFGESLLALTGIALIITGLIQLTTKVFKGKKIDELTISDSIVLGVTQGLAIIPGLSRSGITSSFLLFRGFSGEDSFRISFLMSIPASFGAAALVLMFNGYHLTLYALISLVAALIVGLITIDVLIKMVKKISFWKLCITLGLIAVLSYGSSFLVCNLV